VADAADRKTYRTDLELRNLAPLDGQRRTEFRGLEKPGLWALVSAATVMQGIRVRFRYGRSVRGKWTWFPIEGIYISEVEVSRERKRREAAGEETDQDTLLPPGRITLRGARRKVDWIEEQLERGKDPKPAKRPKALAITQAAVVERSPPKNLKELIAEFDRYRDRRIVATERSEVPLGRNRRLKLSTVQNERRNWRNYVIPFFDFGTRDHRAKPIEPHELTTLAVEIDAGRVGNGLKGGAAAAEHTIRALQLLFSWARRQGYVTVDPAVDLAADVAPAPYGAPAHPSDIPLAQFSCSRSLQARDGRRSFNCRGRKSISKIVCGPSPGGHHQESETNTTEKTNPSAATWCRYRR
jgi:hypothetical protein